MNNIADRFADVGKTIKMPKVASKILSIINYQTMHWFDFLFGVLILVLANSNLLTFLPSAENSY